MTVSAFIHLYPPHHNAGAEHYLHTLFKFLVSKGMTCNVFARDIKDTYKIDGVTVYPRSQKHDIEFSDLVITHLDMTGEAVNLCRKYKLPLIHIIHNSFRNQYILARMKEQKYVFYNAQWIYDKRDHDVPSMV